MAAVMSEHLIDTEIKLGQCNRCDGYVFLAMSSGVRSAADPAPVDRGRYITALAEGRRLFRLVERAGRPYKLRTVRPADLRPQFDANGSQTGVQRLLAEHGCGGHARNMITFREVEQEGPPSARATPGSGRAGGHHHRAAHESGLVVEEIPRSHARHVNRRLSDEAVRCHVCDSVIDQSEPFSGIHHGRWVWAVHEECP